MNLFNSCIIGLSLNTDMLAHHLFKTLYLVDKAQNEIKHKLLGWLMSCLLMFLWHYVSTNI